MRNGFEMTWLRSDSVSTGKGGIFVGRFWEREEEYALLREFLSDPNPGVPLVVFGPKGSGKSTLVKKVLKDLQREYKDLWKREVHVFDYKHRDFSQYGIIQDIYKRFVPKKKIPRFSDFEELLLYLFYEYYNEEDKDAVEKIMENIQKNHSSPIIVLDNLSILSKSYNSRIFYYYDYDDYYYDGFYVYDFYEYHYPRSYMGFFEVIMKLAEIAHVVITASQNLVLHVLFGENPILNGIRYLELDYFDDDKAYDILVSEGMKKGDARYFTKTVGGIPFAMDEALRFENVRKYVESLFKKTKMWFIQFLRSYTNENDLKAMRKILQGEELQGFFKREGYDIRPEFMDVLLKSEIVYYDLEQNTIRFQRKYEANIARNLIRSINKMMRSKKDKKGDIEDEECA